MVCACVGVWDVCVCVRVCVRVCAGVCARVCVRAAATSIRRPTLKPAIASAELGLSEYCRSQGEGLLRCNVRVAIVARVALLTCSV